jgi:cysteine desulfurase
MIYLDWNATAPLRPCARAAWLAAQDAAWANPSSVHRPGQAARAALDTALDRCARLLGCHADELVVTSGGTEGCATVLRGAEGPVVASAIDHSAVLRNAPAGRLRLVPVDGAGRLDPTAFAEAARGAAIACLQLANNEIGTVQDAPVLVAAIRAAEPGCLIFADACQVAGKASLDLHAMGVDAAAIAGHKFGAPKGIGLLYVRRGLRLPALIAGGRQQQDRRSGSEDAALTAALAAALAEAVHESTVECVLQRHRIDAAWKRLHAGLPQARRLGEGAPTLPNTLGVVAPGLDGRHLAMRLDLAGFAVSTGSACMAGRGETSHVARALGLDDGLARSFVRFSIGAPITDDDLNRAVDAYVAAAQALSGMAVA